MITPEEIHQMIASAMPGAVIEVEDMRGTGDHFDITVASRDFAGKTLIDQHRQVFAILENEMNGRIHAVQLKTKILK